jgi:hypothetical protein
MVPAHTAYVQHDGVFCTTATTTVTPLGASLLLLLVVCSGVDLLLPLKKQKKTNHDGTSFIQP